MSARNGHATCPLCHTDITYDVSVCEFSDIPGVMFHSDCMDVFGGGRARRLARQVTSEHSPGWRLRSDLTWEFEVTHS